ncbi:hypothetical protein F5879DRAFT_924221 [Lentinula edodes]|nr:hypothetical protein F5879DRAFT_924221 [Lentinula edodes]
MAPKRKVFEDIFGREKRQPAPSPRPPDPEPTDTQLHSSNINVSVVPEILHTVPSDSSSHTSLYSPLPNHSRSRNGQHLAFRNLLEQNSEILAETHNFEDTNLSFQNDSIPASNINSTSAEGSSNLPRNGHNDYGMSVMAQVILNRDSLAFTPLDLSDLEVIVGAARATVLMESSAPQDNKLAEVFSDPRLKHRLAIDASKRVQSLRKDMQNHLSALQGLSTESGSTIIQTVLGRAERATRAMSLDLRKEAKRDAVQHEVTEATAVLKDVEKLISIWRESYPDVSPLRLDNTRAASNIALDYTTATLIAYTLALTLRLLEGASCTVSSFFLKGMKIFGMSYDLLHPVAYTRGIQCAVSDDQKTPYERTHRVVLANISMDAKASHPFAGLVDIGSHIYCATCQIWHKAYLSSVNYEDWEAIDDEYLRGGAEKWRNAESHAECERIEHLYGVRTSEFWRLPYFRPSKQVSVDPMHALKNIFGNFFYDALRLDNPCSSKEPKNKSTTPVSSIAHHYQFTPPPPLSLVNSAPVAQADSAEEDLVTAVLEWDHLSIDLCQLRHQRMTSLLVKIDAYKRETQLRSRLKSKKWGALIFVCNDLMVFPVQLLHGIIRKALVTKSDITKDDMRLNDIQEDQAFIWPHFTPTSFAPPRAPWASPVLLHTFHGQIACRSLTDAERKAMMGNAARRMNWHSAIGVGHIHQLLWAPCDDSDIGKEKLAKALNAEGIDALFCLVDEPLLQRMSQALDALTWTPVDSPAVLKHVNQTIREVTVPSWISKPSEYIGLPRAGTPKADNWRRLFAIFLPLALLSMWQLVMARGVFSAPLQHSSSSFNITDLARAPEGWTLTP